MDETYLLAEFADDDSDMLSLYQADEDPDYLVILLEVGSPTSSKITEASVAFDLDDAEALGRRILEFVQERRP